jgi:hypothetical protein
VSVTWPPSVILTGQKPLFINLAQTVYAVPLDLDIPFLSLPRSVPPFRIRLPNTAAFCYVTAKKLCAEEYQLLITNKNFGLDRRVEIGKGNYWKKCGIRNAECGVPIKCGVRSEGWGGGERWACGG